MDEQNFDGLIPKNHTGKKTDASFTEDYKSKEEALTAYQAAKERLLNISRWHSYAGSGTADFKLTDAHGTEVNRLAREGDHFRINIPGPGSNTGDGYDWVQIQSIQESNNPELDQELMAIIVQPVSNPQNDDQDVAHFFNDIATSTFIVQRCALQVSAEVHGRNEQPNTNTENLIDKARNMLVAVGAILGLSEIQWKSLVKGLIKPENI